MADNEEQPIQSSDLGGATNNTTTTKSDLVSYISLNHAAEVLEIVLENVLCFLTSTGDRNAASLVCKSWYRAEGLTRLDVNIVNSYAVSPSRVINRFPRVTSMTIKGFLGWSSSRGNDCLAHLSHWVKPMTKAYKGLEKVYLKRMHVTNDDLCVLAQSLPGLKELVLVRCKGFGTRGLATVARGCSQIRVFELIKSVVDTEDIVDWISCFPESTSCLESFIFDCVLFPIDFGALEQLLTRSRSLKKLTLSIDVSILQLHRIIILAPQLTHLGRATADSFEDLAQAMVRVRHLFNIRTLLGMVDDDRPEEGQYYADIGGFESLECLSGLKGASRREIVQVCGSNLKMLDLSGTFSTIKAKEILHCPMLQSLKVNDYIEDEGLKKIAATCKDLHEFCLYEEKHKGLVSELGLLAIFEGCRKLQHIKYEGREMTNAVLLAISKNCPDLRVLGILVKKRERGILKRERTRDPDNDSSFDIGIEAIVKNCKKITRLKMCGLLTDRAFQYIGEFGKLLQSLCFNFNEKSDMGLKYVLEGCSKLQKLEILNCPFSDLGCYTPEEMRASLPRDYSMKLLLHKLGFDGVSSAGCGNIARLLFDTFGLEAHVMLCKFMSLTTDGHMKIYLRR